MIISNTVRENVVHQNMWSAHNKIFIYIHQGKGKHTHVGYINSNLILGKGNNINMKHLLYWQILKYFFFGLLMCI